MAKFEPTSKVSSFYRMNWLYTLSSTDYLLLTLFVSLYALYISRTVWLARKLGTTAWGVAPKMFLRSIYVGLLFVALLGPSFGQADSRVATTDTRRDLFIIIDISRSMDATDVVPTRLERAKYAVQQLVDTLVTDRFGLILAGSEPFVLSPLTADHNALRQSVRDVRTGISVVGSTNLCEAIELGRQKLLTDSSTRHTVKGIILFSDGENFTTCDRAALFRLRSLQIPLLTVGVGTQDGTSLRNGRSVVRDADGQPVTTRLNRDFLTQLAQNTGGVYAETSDPQYATELVSFIRLLRGGGSNEQQIALSTNKYYYFLLAALTFLLLDLVMTVRTFSI